MDFQTGNEETPKKGNGGWMVSSCFQPKLTHDV